MEPLAQSIAVELGGGVTAAAPPASVAGSDPLASAITREVGGGPRPAATSPQGAGNRSSSSVIGRETGGSAAPAGGPAATGTVATRDARPGAGRITITVVGEEGVAAATAGHLALLGFDVTWTSPKAAALDPYRGGVELVGIGVGHPQLAASLDEAVRGRDLVLVCTHATEHAAYAALLASTLTDDQVVVLTPGRTGGALEFADVLHAHCVTRRVVIGETETAVYTPAGRGPGTLEILIEKVEIRAAAFPADDTDRLLATLRQVYPQVARAENVLDTSINNVGGVVHPAAMLLASSVTEAAAAGAPLVYYQDQVNPTVANLVMEQLDAERVAVGRAFGLATVLTFREWSLACFRHAGATIRETVATNPYYAGFGAPRDLLALGFVDDEVPNSLVPLAQLGQLVGVRTPMTDAIIDLAAAMLHVDFRRTGRTLERLGLGGLDPAGILSHVNHARSRVPVGV
jgi:opine dehydrogenase